MSATHEETVPERVLVLEVGEREPGEVVVGGVQDPAVVVSCRLLPKKRLICKENTT